MSSYARTPHLPFSKGKTSDDISGDDWEFLKNETPVVVTEKMDGECTTFYNDGFHARSLDSRSTIIAGDLNDEPGGPIRVIFAENDFTEVQGLASSAFIDGQLVSLDVISIRGFGIEPPVRLGSEALTEECPSDHTPAVAVLRKGGDKPSGVRP